MQNQLEDHLQTAYLRILCKPAAHNPLLSDLLEAGIEAESFGNRIFIRKNAPGILHSDALSGANLSATLPNFANALTEVLSRHKAIVEKGKTYHLVRQAVDQLDTSTLIEFFQHNLTAWIFFHGIRIKRLRIDAPNLNLEFETCQITSLTLIHMASFQRCHFHHVITTVNLDWPPSNVTDFLTVDIKSRKGTSELDESIPHIGGGVFRLILLQTIPEKLNIGRTSRIEFREQSIRVWYGDNKHQTAWHSWPLIWHLGLGNREAGHPRHPDLASDEIVRMMVNSYKFMLEQPTFQAHEKALQRYLAYFRARSSRITSILYGIHGSYYKLLCPSIFTLLCAGVLKIALGDSDSAAIGQYIVNPAKLWGQFILRDFMASLAPDWSKILAGVANIGFLYFLFSAAVAIKRRFGFPKE